MQRSTFTGYLQSAVVIKSLNEKSICNQHKSSGLLTYFPQHETENVDFEQKRALALGSYQLLDNQTTSLWLCMCIIHCIAAGKSSLKIHRGSDLFMKH